MFFFSAVLGTDNHLEGHTCIRSIDVVAFIKKGGYHVNYYVGCDLHSNNVVLGVINDKGQRIYKRKVPNLIKAVLLEMEPFKDNTQGVVVESTFNWYWLVDGMMEAGYKLHLANPSAIKQYEGLKHTDDYHDAFHLANLLQMDILPEGYIYPKKQRALRDLSRKRTMPGSTEKRSDYKFSGYLLSPEGMQVPL